MFERFLCVVLGHCYTLERVLSEYARKITCARCGKSWGMHDPTRSFVPWNGELEQFYSEGGLLREK